MTYEIKVDDGLLFKAFQNEQRKHYLLAEQELKIHDVLNFVFGDSVETRVVTKVIRNKDVFGDFLYVRALKPMDVYGGM